MALWGQNLICFLSASHSFSLYRKIQGKYDLSQGLNKTRTYIFEGIPYLHVIYRANTLQAKHQQFLNPVRLLTNIKKHVGFNSFPLFSHFSSHWFRWWFLKKFSYAKKKNNGRELLIHLVNLREKTQSLSFLSDLGSLRIQPSLLAPRC